MDLFNAGHKRGGQALRCEGLDNTVRAFRVFGAAVLCGIGALPGTLHDRSIVIRLARERPGEVTERFDSRRVVEHKETCRKLARWIADNAAQIERCDPTLPDGAFNRMADNWRPLFAIAHTAGGGWLERATEAFNALTATEDHEAQGVGAMLLADIAEAFKSSNTDKLASVALANALSQMEGRPWAEFGKSQKPITANQLAKQLHRFGVSPKPVRFGSGPEDVKKGYCLADFSEPFDRYLGKTPLSNGYTVTTPENIGDSGDFKELQPESLLPMENSIFPNKDGHCNRVTDGKPVIEDELTI